MSAELLRRAAKVLREHAGYATAGPWEYVEGEMDEAISGSSADGLVYSHYGDDAGVPLAQYDGSYIVLMHPPVALALADLLEAHIPLFAGLLDPAPDHEVFAVARAILREPEATS